MAEKVASVGLVLKPEPFIKATRDAKGRFVKSVTEMTQATGTLEKQIEETVKAVQEIAKALPAAVEEAKASGDGLLKVIEKIERKGVGKKLRDALGGSWSAQLAANTRDTDRLFEKMEGRGGKKGMGGGTLALLGGGAALTVAALHKIADFTKKTGAEVNDTEERAAQISVNARGAGQDYIDPKKLLAEAYASAATVKGTTADQALDAVAKFGALTGDFDTARKSMQTFATASKATGADMGSIAQATASISKQFGVTDPEKIKEVLAALTYQGKAGAIELTDLAGGLQRIAAAGAAFGLSKDVGGVKKLGGLTQLARAGTGSGEQAFTAIERVFASLLEKSADFQKAKVKIYEGKGANKHTRGIDDILVDAISKVGGKNLQKKNELLGSLFGGEAMRAINPLVGIYQTAFGGAKGAGGGEATDVERTAAGVAALRKAFDEATNAAGSWKDVQQDASRMTQTNSAKTTAMWENIKAKFGAEVLPKLTLFVDKLTSSPKVIDAFLQSVILLGEGLQSLLRAIGIRSEAEDKQRAAEGKFGHKAVQEEGIRSLEKDAEAAKLVEGLGSGDTSKALREELLRRKGFDPKAEQLPTSPLALKLGLPGAPAPGSILGGAAPAQGRPAGPQPPITIGGTTSPLRMIIVEDQSQRGRAPTPPMPGASPRG